MQFNDAQQERITDHQVCVVYYKKTGAIAHIHQSVTFEGAEAPSREQFEMRAKELAREFATPPTEELEPRAQKLAREFAAKFRGIKFASGPANPEAFSPKMRADAIFLAFS
jgi:hypothetical protein